MLLNFEFTAALAVGDNPAALHFEDNTAHVFYTGDNGRLYGIDTTTPNGEWNNREFSSSLVVAPDLSINYLTLRRISRYGAHGTWKSENKHRFAIYGLDFDVSDYIEDGSIELSLNNPIAAVNASLSNPNQVFINEDESLITPGSKILLNFRAGDSPDYTMGTFYVDRGGYTVLSQDVSVSGRNTIGKVLKDQSFDEKNIYALTDRKTFFSNILDAAGIPKAKYFVADSAFTIGMQFPCEMSILDGIQEALKTMNGWKIQELVDGSIVIGPSNYEKFDQPSTYTFYRDKDIWSRQISNDDMEAYRRVCVHTEDMSNKAYQSISMLRGWGIGAQKTLYVSVPNGILEADCNALAITLASQMALTGVIETFVGPYRPHIQCGDEAEIINTDESRRSIGIITSVKHRFGKEGLSTEFVVDSGGKIGKDKISDYVGKLNKKISYTQVLNIT
jgi:hypothetical protein